MSFQVRAVTVHATNKYFVSASLDSTWCFYDMSSGLCLAQVRKLLIHKQLIPVFSSFSFSPRTMIIESMRNISFTLRSVFLMLVAIIQVTDDSEKVDYTAAAFHPDGLILGTGTAQSIVKIWDVKSQVKSP